MASLNLTDIPTNDPPSVTNNNDNTTPNPVNITTSPASRHVSFASNNNLLATETTTDEHTNNRSSGIAVGFTMPPRQQNQIPITLTPNTEQHPTNDFLLPPFPNDGPLTKACMALSMGTNLTMAAECTTALYVELLAEGAGPTSTKLILTFGDQLAPFPLLATTTKNTIVVLHGIKRLIIPYGQAHLNKGHTIGFLGDTTPGYGVPPIIKLDTKDFNDAPQPWFHPELATLQGTQEQQVLPVPENLAMVHTPKIIPRIPLFLVPFFINGEKPDQQSTQYSASNQNFS